MLPAGQLIRCAEHGDAYSPCCPWCTRARVETYRRALATGDAKPPTPAAVGRLTGRGCRGRAKAAVVQGAAPPPAAPPQPCPYEGPIVRRWPSDCDTKVQALSVRTCTHPDSPGACSRTDNAAHRLAGVRACHGRGCPLTPA